MRMRVPFDHRGLCLRDGIESRIREVGAPHGSGLRAVRCVVEHDCAWLLADKRLTLDLTDAAKKITAATKAA